jgi:predicted 2-oxoglutarate/Fe(II)-dependent dioxygenase YbiX
MPALTDAIWQFDRFLAPEACEGVMQRAADAGLQVARLHAEGRHNREVFLDWPELRELILQRLRERRADCPELALESTLIGRHLECYRYDRSDYVAPHVDARVPVGADARSNLTLIVYLDDGAVGGETVFPKEGVRIRPAAGTAVLFRQRLLHGGAPVTAGCKHVLRADLACPQIPGRSGLDPELPGPGTERTDAPHRRP